MKKDMKEQLTELEIKVLEGIRRNLSNQQIASELHYSYGYIKNVRSSIFAKAGVSGTAELVRLLKENGDF